MPDPRDPMDGMLNEDDRPGQNLNRGAGTGDIPLESLALRIRRLEDVAFEGDGLTRAVTRLGLNANALGEALLQVDKNQQQLTKLGTELQEVRATSAAKTEVAAQVTKEKKARRQLAFLVFLPVVLVLASLIFGISEAAHDACEKRQAATRANIDVLKSFKTGGPGDTLLNRGIGRLEATLLETCDDQYVLHLP